MINNVLVELFEDKNVGIAWDDKLGILFEVYSTGMALGYVTKSKGKNYPHKIRIEEHLKTLEISTVVHNCTTYMNESQLYVFMIGSKTDKCKVFKKWITSELLPKLRRQGYYISENITNTQVERLETEVKELKEKIPTYLTHAQASNILGYENGIILEKDLIKHQIIFFNGRDISSADARFIRATKRTYKFRSDNILKLKELLDSKNKQLFMEVE